MIDKSLELNSEEINPVSFCRDNTRPLENPLLAYCDDFEVPEDVLCAMWKAAPAAVREKFGCPVRFD
jgi:hypothetical protein